jgi:hypothetical protein
MDWNPPAIAALRKAAGTVSVDVWNQVWLVLLWGVSLVVVGARDEFPINDDWAYSLPIIALKETGTFQLSHWQSMPLAPQLAWGWLASALLGTTAGALRLSTQLLALVAVLCLYRLIRSKRSSSAVAFLGAATLLGNPLFIASCNTFMTDVPFVALLLLSLHWFMRAATDSSLLNLGVAFLFALLATLVRQLGVAVAIAFCVVTMAHWGVGKRWLLRAAAPTLMLLGALPAFRLLLELTIGVPALYDEKNLGLSRAVHDLFSLNLGVLRGPLERGWMSLGVLGFSLLPFSLLLIASAPQTRQRTLGAVALAGLCGGLFAVVRVLLPELHDQGSLLVGAGVGPMTLPGPQHAGTPLWLAQGLGGVAAAGAGMLLIAKWSVLRGRVNALRLLTEPGWSLPMLTLVFALGPLLLVYGPFFDRYLLFAIPLWIVACVRPSAGLARLPKGALIGALALALALLVFSTAATRDLFAWNRVRWSVANTFVSENPREQLDAGFEFNNFAENLAELELHERLALTTVSRASAPFAIQFRAAEGQRVVDRFAVDAWLPTSPRELVLVTRK